MISSYFSNGFIEVSFYPRLNVDFDMLINDLTDGLKEAHSLTA
jgi:hypothetical protein